MAVTSRDIPRHTIKKKKKKKKKRTKKIKEDGKETEEYLFLVSVFL